MSKFCQNCGTQMGDNDTFCVNCGAPAVANNAPVTPNQPVAPVQGINQPNVPVGTNQIPTAPTTNKKKRNIIIASVSAVLVVVIAVVSCIFIFGGNSPTDVVDNYMECMLHGSNADDMLKLVPSTMLNAKLADEDETLEEVKSDLNNKLTKVKINFNAEYSNPEWTIISEQDMKIDDLKDINDECNDYGTIVTEAKEISVVGAVTNSSGKKETDNIDIEVIKVDGDWYIYKANGSKLINDIF